MNASEQKTSKWALVMSWLQIILGILFLGLALYKYLINGYNFAAINLPLTIIFGIVLPVIAMGNLYMAKKGKDNHQ